MLYYYILINYNTYTYNTYCIFFFFFENVEPRMDKALDTDLIDALLFFYPKSFIESFFFFYCIFKIFYIENNRKNLEIKQQSVNLFIYIKFRRVNIKYTIQL